MKQIKDIDLDNSIKAILKAQNHIQWKLGKANPHLSKRINLGHLPENATIAVYEELIDQVLTDAKAKIYIYLYESTIYPTITSIIKEKLWLVMIGIDGILETAFPPENPSNYLSNTNFTYSLFKDKGIHWGVGRSPHRGSTPAPRTKQTCKRLYIGVLEELLK